MKYLVRMMTTDNYKKYLNGNDDFEVIEQEIGAKSRTGAIAVAKITNPGMIVNEEYVPMID